MIFTSGSAGTRDARYKSGYKPGKEPTDGVKFGPAVESLIGFGFINSLWTVVAIFPYIQI